MRKKPVVKKDGLVEFNIDIKTHQNYIDRDAEFESFATRVLYRILYLLISIFQKKIHNLITDIL